MNAEREQKRSEKERNESLDPRVVYPFKARLETVVHGHPARRVKDELVIPPLLERHGIELVHQEARDVVALRVCRVAPSKEPGRLCRGIRHAPTLILGGQPLWGVVPL